MWLLRQPLHQSHCKHLQRFVDEQYVSFKLLRKTSGLCGIMNEIKGSMVISLTICQLEEDEKKKAKLMVCPNLCK